MKSHRKLALRAWVAVLGLTVGVTALTLFGHPAARAHLVTGGSILTIPQLPDPTTTTVRPPTTTTTVAPALATTTSAPRPVVHAASQSAFDPTVIGRQALRLVSYPWGRLNTSIVFAGPNPNMRARTDLFSDHSQIVAFVRPGDSTREVAVSIAHELGHLIDWELLNDSDRQQWLNERGRPNAAWWTCNFCGDFTVGTGDFAETFAAWLIGPYDYRSQLAPLPTPEQMQSLSRFFRR